MMGSLIATLNLEILHFLFEGLNIIIVEIGKGKDDRGVTIVNNLAIRKKLARRSIENKLIGSFHVLLMTEKVVATWPLLMRTLHHLSLISSTKSN